MADRHDLDFTYSLIDRIFRLSLGELADFSGAKFDGDLVTRWATGTAGGRGDLVPFLLCFQCGGIFLANNAS